MADLAIEKGRPNADLRPRLHLGLVRIERKIDASGKLLVEMGTVEDMVGDIVSLLAQGRSFAWGVLHMTILAAHALLAVGPRFPLPVGLLDPGAVGALLVMAVRAQFRACQKLRIFDFMQLGGRILPLPCFTFPDCF